MPVSIPVNLITGFSSIRSVSKADERKTFCTASISILGKKNTGNPAKALENLAKIILFSKFGDLRM